MEKALLQGKHSLVVEKEELAKIFWQNVKFMFT